MTSTMTTNKAIHAINWFNGEAYEEYPGSYQEAIALLHTLPSITIDQRACQSLPPFKATERRFVGITTNKDRDWGVEVYLTSQGEQDVRFVRIAGGMNPPETSFIRYTPAEGVPSELILSSADRAKLPTL